jgi:hypothetical protein
MLFNPGPLGGPPRVACYRRARLWALAGGGAFGCGVGFGATSSLISKLEPFCRAPPSAAPGLLMAA